MVNSDHAEFIYKICPEKDWDKACETGAYTGSVDDKRDGFIHFSFRHQVRGTLDKHFAGQQGLLLLVVKVDQLEATALKFEISRGGDEFPHLYGNLFPYAVKARYIIEGGVILTEGTEGEPAEFIEF